jgi:hypothetical protein
MSFSEYHHKTPKKSTITVTSSPGGSGGSSYDDVDISYTSQLISSKRSGKKLSKKIR